MEERMRKINERTQFAQRKRDSIVRRSTMRRVCPAPARTQAGAVRAVDSRRAPPDQSADKAEGRCGGLQMPDPPALRRLPFFKVYKNRQDEVYNMLCALCGAVRAAPESGDTAGHLRVEARGEADGRDARSGSGGRCAL